MVNTISHLGLTKPDSFFWATGIEDTFITHPWPATGRILDEYELTGHYQAWKEDLALMADLGVKVARYGIPWHRVNPARGKWDWSFADQNLDHLLQLGIEPIVDLVHYGLPGWIEGAFINSDFPEYMAEYASRLAERFKGRVYLYTPLNEPRVTAWYCGKLGWWPPALRGWRGFVRVMLGICRGITRTVQRLHEVDPEILPVYVDATDIYETADPSLEAEARQRQELVFLALDLVSGKVQPGHPLYPWLLRQKASEAELGWFAEHPVSLPLIGINLYPLFSKKILVRSGGLRLRMPYASAEIVTRLGRMYWERYGQPLFISETASLGSVRRRRLWLEDSIAAVRELRGAGVPLVGYTWWPMFALVTWAYRQGRHPPAYYLKQMGLWDLDPDLRRIETPLVSEYREFVRSGSEPVGPVTEARTNTTEMHYVS